MSDNEPRDLDADELGVPPAEDTDEREQLVAAALERFFGGHAEGEE